ncbi:MAG TPA: MucB/RseB C-terminal domain-containing protein [Gallionella sp.]|nr:MucB/RseB C-terminal domain-containing protein [Gallionella sp.]
MKLCLAVLGLLLAGSVYAEEEKSSYDWLKMVTLAAHQTDYSGVFVYQYDNQVETSLISHIVGPDSEYEKIESLDGPRREIVRHHGQAWCITDQKVVQLNNRLARGGLSFILPEQLPALSANYQVEEIGVERVAGYASQVVLLKPRDNLRYAHKIWVYSTSGLPLRTAVLDDRNQLVEQYTFTQLKMGNEVDHTWISSLNAPDINSASAKDPDAEKISKFADSGWVVDGIPAGFTKIMEVQRPMHGRHMPVTQLVFSDGLAAFSVFIELLETDQDEVEGLSSRGAVNLYHRQVDNHLYTVVGEVPPRTVMQVLDSIRYNGR